MGGGTGGSDAVQSSLLSGAPPLPPTQIISTASPAPVRVGRYRRESGLRSSSSVPTFATYWKPGGIDDAVPTTVTPAPIPAGREKEKDGSNFPRPTKPSRSGPLGSDGAPSYYPGSPPSSSRWWFKGSFVALLVVLGISLVYLGFLLGQQYLQREALQFAIVLDGGSTGTRVHVHGWAHSAKDPLPVMVDPTNKQNPGSPAQHGARSQQRLYKRVETEPGLDKLFHNRTGIKTALVPLLDWAGKHIPRYAHANTQIFLLATAGLRRLPKYQSDWILDEAWAVLNKSPFICKRSSVKVIKGIEEAYYGWIALNYNFGRLGHIPKQTNFGALDLGGSSLEVTFEPRDVPHGDYGVNLSVGATDHHLYAMSHAGFGLNDAWEKSVAELLRAQIAAGDAKPGRKNRVEVKHPCLQTGYRSHYKCSSHCMLPPLAAQGARRQAPGGSSNGAASVQVDLVGAPHWEACSALAQTVINSSEFVPCSVRPCALGKHQPFPQGQFYGLAGFFVVYKFFRLSQEASLDELLGKGQEFCKLPWKEAESSVDPQPSIEQYCFRSPYVVALLREGLHLHDNQIQIGSGDFAWTLGAALWEAGALNPVQKGEGNSAFSQLNPHLAITVVLLLVLVVILVAVSWRLRFRRRSGYLPLATSNSAANWLPAHLRNAARGETLYGYPLLSFEVVLDIVESFVVVHWLNRCSSR